MHDTLCDFSDDCFEQSPSSKAAAEVKREAIVLSVIAGVMMCGIMALWVVTSLIF